MGGQVLLVRAHPILLCIGRVECPDSESGFEFREVDPRLNSVHPAIDRWIGFVHVLFGCRGPVGEIAKGDTNAKGGVYINFMRVGAKAARKSAPAQGHGGRGLYVRHCADVVVSRILSTGASFLHCWVQVQLIVIVEEYRFAGWYPP